MQAVSARAAAASTLSLRNVRRPIGSPWPQRPAQRGASLIGTSAQFDCGSMPACRVFVLFVQLGQINDDVSAILMQREPIHCTRRAAGDEAAIRLVLRLVLGALKAGVGFHPVQRRVLM